MTADPTISAKVRQIALDSGLSVRQIALQSGTNLSSVQRFMAGDGCYIGTLDAIAALFGVSATGPTKHGRQVDPAGGRPKKVAESAKKSGKRA
jgi:hypothetical protein